jgi:hypothetical protein
MTKKNCKNDEKRRGMTKKGTVIPAQAGIVVDSSQRPRRTFRSRHRQRCLDVRLAAVVVGRQQQVERAHHEQEAAVAQLSRLAAKRRGRPRLFFAGGGEEGRSAIPAFAGMTKKGAGTAQEGAGTAKKEAGKTKSAEQADELIGMTTSEAERRREKPSSRRRPGSQ